MNVLWSVVVTLKTKKSLTYVSIMFSINCPSQFPAAGFLNKLQWKVVLRRLRRWHGCCRQQFEAAARSGQWRETHQKLDRVHSCTSMPLVLLYIAPWSQWSFCSTGDVCIAKQGSYRSTCSHSPRFILWGQKKGDRGNGKVRHGLAPPSGQPRRAIVGRQHQPRGWMKAL